MPAQPNWFKRLPDILYELRALHSVEVLDRQAIEAIFRVQDRRARVLIAEFGGRRTGNGWVISRTDLIAALERVERGENFQYDSQRRRRVAEVYEEAKRLLPARQITIAVPPEAAERTLDSLPPGVRILPNELRIDFASFEDLLRKLFELSQVVQNDFERLRQIIG